MFVVPAICYSTAICIPQQRRAYTHTGIRGFEGRCRGSGVKLFLRSKRSNTIYSPRVYGRVLWPLRFFINPLHGNPLETAPPYTGGSAENVDRYVWYIKYVLHNRVYYINVYLRIRIKANKINEKKKIVPGRRLLWGGWDSVTVISLKVTKNHCFKVKRYRAKWSGNILV